MELYLEDLFEIGLKLQLNQKIESTVVLFGVNDIDVIISRNDFKNLIHI